MLFQNSSLNYPSKWFEGLKLFRGSGAVGQALAKGFIGEGHEVYLATRQPDSEKGRQLEKDIAGAHVTDFVTAATEAVLAVLCVHWRAAEEAIAAAGSDNLAGKVVIDTSNPLQPEGASMVLSIGTDTSAGEHVQAWLPDSKIVKAFNTVGTVMMYRPDFDVVPTMFIAGDNSDAKKQVAAIVTAFGWEALDVGGIVESRELEPMALLWVKHSMASGTAHHAYKML